MLKHTVTHRSNSSLGSCSLPYVPNHPIPCRRSSLASRTSVGHDTRQTESAHCSPMPGPKIRESATGLHRKVNSARSFVELVNLIDSYPSLIDFESEDTASEASYSSGAPVSLPVMASSKPPTGREMSGRLEHRPMTLPRKGDCKMEFRRPSLQSINSFTSLQSSMSCASLNSAQTLMGSKVNSMDSLSETIPVKVFMKRLRPDIEYKTMALTSGTTCRQMIHSLLTKFRLRHRDPNLFFVTMEVSVHGKSDAVPSKRVLVLDDDARPAELQQCHPRGESRFSIGVRKGGLVRVHDSILMPGSQYKSLMIADNTTVDELVQLLLKCYNNLENPKHFALHEVSRQPYHDHPLAGDQCPLIIQGEWPLAQRPNKAFVLRRNLAYTFNLKSRMTWRRSVDQTSTDTEYDLDDVTKSSLSSVSETRGSSISSTSSVSSNCSSHSSESSIDSGYLGSPAFSFKAPPKEPLKPPPKEPIKPLPKELVKPPPESMMEKTKDVPPPLPKRNESMKSPLTSIPMTPTVSKLTSSVNSPKDTPVPLSSSTPVPRQTTIITISGKTSTPLNRRPIYPRRTLVPLKAPSSFRKLPDLPNLKVDSQRSSGVPNVFSSSQTTVRPSQRNTTPPKPKVIAETPKEPLPSYKSSTLPAQRYQPRRLPQVPPRNTKIEPRIVAEILKSTPTSSCIKKPFPPPPSPNATHRYRNYFLSTGSATAEREFLDAVEALRCIGSPRESNH